MPEYNLPCEMARVSVPTCDAVVGAADVAVDVAPATALAPAPLMDEDDAVDDDRASRVACSD